MFQVGVLVVAAGCGKVPAAQPDASDGSGGDCTTSTECTDPSMPFCIDSQCVAACQTDDDCAGTNSTPYCASDGACVACKTNAECSTNAPVCDATDRACRGCEEDSECESGVCLEAEGTCADANNVLFVKAGGADTGTCAMTAPCSTLTYALSKVTSQHNVIHILGATFSTDGAVVSFTNGAVTVDGSDTTVTRGDIGPVFTLPANGAPTVVLSGLKIGVSGTNNESVSVAGHTMQLHGVTLNAPATVSGGILDVGHSVLADKASVTCTTNGTLHVTDSQLHATIYTQDCTLTMQRNRHESVSAATLNANATMLLVENNTIVNSDYFTDPMTANGLAGSFVRFNTFVNVSGVDMGATSLTCNQMVTATSNIFAWHSSSQPNCATKYSLFDQLAGTPAGTGNRSADVATFFVDVESKDLHLAASSPAKGMAEPGLVDVDADGNPRPLPASSNPDIGAYEAP